MHGAARHDRTRRPGDRRHRPVRRAAGMNTGVNALGQGNRATTTTGRALQLVVRNVGGGAPRRRGPRRPRPARQARHVLRRAPRRDRAVAWARAGPRRAARGETGVTLFAGEAPRLIVDQLARDPDGAARLAGDGARAARHPAPALRVRRAAGRRARARPHLQRGRLVARPGPGARCTSSPAPAGELVRGAGGIAEGLQAHSVTDPRTPVPKFAAPERILLAYAGGDAGLFSMVFGGWVAGEIGSTPRDAEHRAMALTILDPTAERDAAGAPLAPRGGPAGDDRAARHPQAARRRVPRRARARCCASAATSRCARPSRRSPSPRRSDLRRDIAAPLRRGDRGARRLRLLRVVRSAGRDGASKRSARRRSWPPRVRSQQARRAPVRAARPARAEPRAHRPSNPGPHRRGMRDLARGDADDGPSVARGRAGPLSSSAGGAAQAASADPAPACGMASR